MNYKIILIATMLLSNLNAIAQSNSGFNLNEYGNIVNDIDYTEVATDKKVKDPRNKYIIYKIVEKNARFKGGISAMNKYILTNLEYPVEFIKSDYEKITVQVLVVINEKGQVELVDLKSGFKPSCDAIAKRIVENMPAWIPASQHGIKVKQGVIIDIVFDRKNSAGKVVDYHINKFGKIYDKNYCPAVVEYPKEKHIQDEIFEYVELEPTFIGGEDAKFAFISKNLKYPQQAANNGIEGNVYVEFVIRKDSRITNAKIIRGLGLDCDEEALRVVNLMSSLWNPGKQHGKAVDVKYTIPISFHLE